MPGRFADRPLPVAEPHEILRSTRSFACRLLTSLFITDGTGYLGRLVVPLLALVKKSAILDTPQGHTDHLFQVFQLTSICEQFTKDLSTEITSCPTSIRLALSQLSSAVVARLGHTRRALDIISSIFFLHFICPAILQPASFGLISQTEAPPIELLPLIILLVKILQRLANGNKDIAPFLASPLQHHQTLGKSKEAATYVSKIQKLVTVSRKAIRGFMERLTDRSVIVDLPAFTSQQSKRKSTAEKLSSSVPSARPRSKSIGALSSSDTIAAITTADNKYLQSLFDFCAENQLVKRQAAGAAASAVFPLPPVARGRSESVHDASRPRSRTRTSKSPGKRGKSTERKSPKDKTATKLPISPSRSSEPSSPTEPTRRYSVSFSQSPTTILVPSTPPLGGKRRSLSIIPSTVIPTVEQPHSPSDNWLLSSPKRSISANSLNMSGSTTPPLSAEDISVLARTTIAGSSKVNKLRRRSKAYTTDLMVLAAIEEQPEPKVGPFGFDGTRLTSSMSAVESSELDDSEDIPVERPAIVSPQPLTPKRRPSLGSQPQSTDLAPTHSVPQLFRRSEKRKSTVMDPLPQRGESSSEYDTTPNNTPRVLPEMPRSPGLEDSLTSIEADLSSAQPVVVSPRGLRVPRLRRLSGLLEEIAPQALGARLIPADLISSPPFTLDSLLIPDEVIVLVLLRFDSQNAWICQDQVAHMIETRRLVEDLHVKTIFVIGGMPTELSPGATLAQALEKIHSAKAKHIFHGLHFGELDNILYQEFGCIRDSTATEGFTQFGGVFVINDNKKVVFAYRETNVTHRPLELSDLLFACGGPEVVTSARIITPRAPRPSPRRNSTATY